MADNGLQEGGKTLERAIVRQSGWVAVSYGTRSVLGMASTLALVHLLDPRAFGLVALAWTFLTILQHLQESGLGAALIQRRENLHEAAATVFVSAAATSLAAAAFVAAVAPLAGRLLHAPGLAGILWALTPLLLLRGLAVVPSALLERDLDYRRRARADVTAGLTQPLVAIALAVAGAGVWSLVAGQLASGAVLTVLLWAASPLRPNPRKARLAVLRTLMRYGRFVSGANVVNLLNDTLDNLTVARLLGTRMLGFYSVTWRLADMPNTVIGNIVGRVLFPVYSAFREDRETVARHYLQNLQRVALLALPVSAVLAAGAGPIVRGLLGPSWDPVVGPLRLLAVYGAVKALAAPSGEVFKGVGRPHLALGFASIHAVLVVPALVLLTPRYGLTGAAAALLAVVCASGLPALVTSLRVLHVRLAAAAAALAPPLACAGAVAAAIVVATRRPEAFGPAGTLALVLAVAAASYGAAVALLARPIVVPIVGAFRGRPQAGAATDAGST